MNEDWEDDVNEEHEGGLKEEIDLEKLLREAPDIARAMARRYIKQFFAGEQYHAGGDIPDSILLADRYVNLVLELNTCDGVEKAYELLNNSREPIPHLYPEELEAQQDMERYAAERPDDEPKSDERLDSDVQLIIGLIHRCAKREIPQPFVAGIFCIYLELCHGMTLYRFTDE